ncbi:MAG: protein YghO [Deferrisomatales bacterium]
MSQPRRDAPPPPSFVRVAPVEGRRALEAFLRLPWSLYRDDPAWVPPLLLERRQHLSPRNPYFEHARLQAWLAYRDGRPVGRITAQVDRLHLERYDDRTGFFGMLEAVDDPEVFEALFHAAQRWLAREGMDRVRGPFSLSINDECGLLVEGFDTPPHIMMGHARPYYARRLEALGFTKAKDLLAYRISNEDYRPAGPTAALAERMRRRVRIRAVRRERFQEDLEIIRDIFDDAWSRNWGFIPFTAAELEHLGRNLKQFVPLELAQIAEVDGEPAAMIVLFPNLNEAIQDLDGRLLPLGWLKLLWRLKVRGLRSGRVPLMGVRRRYQRGMMGAALALLLVESVRKEGSARGITEGELSWILEDNTGMRSILEAVGCEAYKRYRIYEKPLAPGPPPPECASERAGSHAG